MNIILENQTEEVFTKDDGAFITGICKETLKLTGFADDYEATYMLVSNDEIKVLNNRFRRINSETDVLTFPFWEGDPPPPKDGYLGDVAISVEKIFSQSEDLNHSTLREFGFLVAHSMLHLLGYDHESEEELEEMAKKQEQILEKVGLVR